MEREEEEEKTKAEFCCPEEERKREAQDGCWGQGLKSFLLWNGEDWKLAVGGETRLFGFEIV